MEARHHQAKTCQLHNMTTLTIELVFDGKQGQAPPSADDV